MTARTYSMLTTPVVPTSGSGLDQLVDIIDNDPGLAGANKASDIAGGAAAADGLNGLIVEAAVQTGAASDGKFTADEVVAMNAYIRAHRLDEWTALHGDDEDGLETGFHLVQGDGATTPYRGQNAVNTVADGLYHLGFEIVDGHFLNEDGNANASVGQVAKWLTQFWTDHSTTGTGLDRIVDLMMADGGLARTIPEAQIEAGANAANGLNSLLVEAIANTGVAQDGWISTEDAVTLNAYVRANHLAEWTLLHGDDNGDQESGYHVVQNDGATTQFFGKNLFDTVADGLYHLGFEIVNGRFLNEDDNQNGSVANIASYLNYFFTDLSTTNTGLDRIVDTIKIDRGLSTNTPAANINEGAKAADNLNHLLVDAIQATNAMADGWITTDDLYAINAWVRSDAGRLAQFIANHGDDENGTETGYHLVQGDGATTKYFGLNLVDTVADGLYHFGFDIEQGRFVNEDGNANASLTDVASWLNYFYGNRTVIIGGGSSETINGSADAEMIVGHGGGDAINAGAGDDLVDAGDGNDTANGGAGSDILYGGLGRDILDGGDDSDIYRVSGNVAEGWPSFQDYDTYKDTGASGVDVIQAIGPSDVDIAVRGFVAAGIEVIDGSAAAGTVRLLADWTANVLDFGATSFVGGNIVIDADSGNDTIYGTTGDDTVLAGYGSDKVYGGAGNDRIVAGGGNDTLDGQDGSDTYEVTGNRAGGWESFQDYDTYKDTGTGPGDVDTIKAIGAGDVDIGLLKLDAASGIERIDGSAAAGTVRLIADWTANVLDFRATSFVGGNIVIDADSGNDTIYGTTGDDTVLAGYGSDKVYGDAGNDRIVAGGGNDTLDGQDGSDTYEVTGNRAGGWESFQDYDTYKDTGTGPGDVDTIKAIGAGDVDIGLLKFDAASGIERIDASAAAGTVRLLADWTANVLDFRATSFVGGNIVIDADSGNDTIYGTVGDDTVLAGYGSDKVYGGAGNDRIVAGGGNDTLDGQDGSDTYEVTGNRAGGWESFQDYDTYKDTGSGSGDVDTIKAIGAGDVDIGLLKFDAASGIERIDGSAAAGTVRLLADWTANVLDFRATSFVGGNIVIDADGGNDTVFGTDGKDRILGRSGNDVIDGGAGDDAIAGGEGKDVLTGGLGADHFVFDTSLSAGVDKIVDLAPGIDLIELAAAIFGNLGGPGVLSADQFVIGSKALDGNDHVLYNAATGVLSYDADGNGAGGAIAFAQLLTGLSLGASDFLVT